MAGDLLDTLAYKKSEFSKGHKKIADYLLDNYDKAAFMTAGKLAKAAEVSEPTVVRFASALGYKKYTNFQDALLKTAHNRMTVVQRMEISKNRIGNTEVLKKVLLSDMEKIRLPLENIDAETFGEVVDDIIKARRIYILGVRSSSALAEFLGFYFNLLFDDVRIVGNTNVSAIYEQVFHIGKGDILIAISYPRYSKRTVKAIKFANSRGAEVVALTDSSMSPLCRYAKYSLFADSDITSIVDSLVAPLSLVNSLIAAVSIKKEKDLTSVLQELEDIWDENEVYDANFQ